MTTGNVIRVPGSDSVGIIYFVNRDNPPCVDCDAPSFMVAIESDQVSQHTNEIPVCAVDAAYRAADGQTIRRFEDEDIITRGRFPEPITVRRTDERTRVLELELAEIVGIDTRRFS